MGGGCVGECVRVDVTAHLVCLLRYVANRAIRRRSNYDVPGGISVASIGYA